MSSIQGMIQSNKMNRGMQRSGQFFSALKTMSTTTNGVEHVLSMEIDHTKLESIELKWEKQRRSDRIKVILAIVFLIVSLVVVCSVMPTWNYSSVWQRMDIG